MKLIEYKGYHASVEFSPRDVTFVGHVIDLADVIHFEAENAKDVEVAFHEAVDDYLEFCAEIGKEPEKPFKGKMLVRLTPEQHKTVFLEARRRGMSQNEFAVEALVAHATPLEERQPYLSITMQVDAGSMLGTEAASAEETPVREGGKYIRPVNAPGVGAKIPVSKIVH